MINLTSDFSNGVRSIYQAGDSGSPYSKVLHVGPVHTNEGKTVLNGTNFKMNVNTRTVKADLAEGIKGLLDPTGLRAALDQTKSVSLFTVGRAAIAGTMELTPLQGVSQQSDDQQYIIGYSEVSATNASRSLILRTAN